MTPLLTTRRFVSVQGADFSAHSKTSGLQLQKMTAYLK